MSHEEEFLDFNCPHCRELVSYPGDLVGYARECFNCLESLIVPPPGQPLGGKIPVPITTDRLILRRFQANDWKQLLELAAHEGFQQFTDGLEGREETHILQWLERDRLTKLTSADQFFRLAVTRQTDARLLGYVAMKLETTLEHQATVTGNLHPDYRRQGYGLEALRALLGFGFRGLHLHRVIASCEQANEPAWRLFEKAGLRREADFVKDHRGAGGAWMNSYWYGLLDEEFLGESPTPP